MFSHCVPRPSKDRLSYCVFSCCTHCLQEHFAIPRSVTVYLVPRKPVIILCLSVVYPVPPRTLCHTVFSYGVLTTTKNRLSYCVFSWCTHCSRNTLPDRVLSRCTHCHQNRLSYCAFSWCTQCLQKHFAIPCSLMVYPVPPRTRYHSVFNGLPSAPGSHYHTVFFQCVPSPSKNRVK